MFPSSWPEDLSDAHCTLLYLGDMSEANFTKEDLQIVLQRLATKSPGDVAITGLDLFGPDKNVLVATLDNGKLQQIRDSFERTLAKINVHNASEYKEFKPHVTIDDEYTGTLEEAYNKVELPETVNLGAPELWWGNEHGA